MKLKMKLQGQNISITSIKPQEMEQSGTAWLNAYKLQLKIRQQNTN